jgi:hypothetical protein
MVIAGAAFDFFAEVRALFVEVVGEGFQAHFHVGSVSLGFAPGVYGVPLWWHGADFSPTGYR